MVERVDTCTDRAHSLTRSGTCSARFGPTPYSTEFAIVLLSRRLRLDPTPAQRDYFARAAGIARRVWNWPLAEWNHQVAAGQKPDAMALKKQFNRIKCSDPDWLDDDGQPFANLAKAWSRYFGQRRRGQQAHRPRFKKKGRCRDAFYIAKDKFRIEGMEAMLPKVGRVQMREQCNAERVMAN